MSYRSAKKPILLRRGRNRKTRPKTFHTEEAAKKWAEENGLKKYSLVDMKNPGSKKRKIKVIEQ
ncbi:MAG: hypothetical protein R6U32_04740 [Candidatus Woesearchaeota archaeon]